MSKLAFLLDTNILIGLLDDQDASSTLLADNGAVIETSAVSQITRIEMLSFPALDDSGRRQIEELLARLVVIGIDPAVENAAIQLRQLKRLKLPDAIVGATAVAHKLKLLTLDKKLAGAVPKP